MIFKNNKIYNETIERSRYFRDVHALPLTDEFDYLGWLKNFNTDKDIELACRILDLFSYYPKKMVDQMLITSVGRAGYELSKYFHDWKHSDFKTRCFYSFIPGENPNLSDSGNLFIRKLRDVLDIPESRFIDYREIHQLLERSSIPLPVIFVDDFVGSGAQCYKAWCQNRGGSNKLTLQEISIRFKHKFVYTPLIVNYIGYNRISNYCQGLKISSAHIIGEEYNLFNPNCICWEKDAKLYNSGTELILRKSKELNIPSTNGRKVNDEKGFGMQGLALAFEHGAPDAIPAFFYWSSDNWTPLIKKVYVR